MLLFVARNYDTNKFYSYNDFQNNVTSTVNNVIDYTGISELMDVRSAYLNNYPGFNNEPTIDSVNYYPLNFSNGDDIWITTKATEATDVLLYYRNGSNQTFKTISMLDNGLNNDGASNDSIYGAKISKSGNLIEYYIYAENDSAGSFLPKRAAYEFFTIQQEINVGDLVINELLATNQSYNTNSNGEYNDWIELFNPSEFCVSTIGLYLSDDSTDLQKWSLPERSIAPSSYLSVWADNKSELLGLHANFKLESNGETLILSYGSSDSIIDSITFPNQSIDVSFGRSPNGSGPFNYLYPSYNYNNDLVSVDEISNLESKVFPNPFTDSFTIFWKSLYPSKIKIFGLG